MIMLEKIKKISFDISTLYYLGHFSSKFHIGQIQIGAMLASISSLPLIILNFLLTSYLLKTYLSFYLYQITLIILSYLIIYFATKNSQNDLKAILLDQILGLSIVFNFIPVTTKLFIFGFILFHTSNYFIKKYMENNSQIPTSLLIFTPSIISGFACNLFITSLLWLTN